MLDEIERAAYLANLSATFGLPAVDPIALGVGAIVDTLIRN
jgi:uncharacterized NAD-dependent epimerase/dehydratase family protein